MSVNEISENIDFLLFEKGELVSINTQELTALILGSSASSGYYISDRTVYLKTAIATGAEVDYQNKFWLVISQIKLNNGCYKAIIRECNYVVKLCLDDWLYEFHSILEMQSMNFEGVKVVTVDGKLNATLPYNALTNLIVVNQRFIASKSAWRVLGMDTTRQGLITLDCERGLFEPGDDKDNEIPSGVPLWSLTVTNSASTLSVGSTMTLDITLKKDNTAVSGESFVCESSDTSIVTCNGNELTAQSLGNAVVEVKWAKHPTISSLFNVTVEENVPEVISYKMYLSELDGSDETESFYDILEGTTMKLTMKKFINDVLATVNDTYTFTVNSGGATSVNYAYTVLGDDSISIQNKKEFYGGALTITAVSNQSSVSTSKPLVLSGAW